MLREFLQQKKSKGQLYYPCYGGGDGGEALSSVGQTELSLGPSPPLSAMPGWEEPATQSSIELQLQAPLPPDWEQCLDLQSGRMYYVNRRTLKKSWEWPRDQLDLDLNISTPRSRSGGSPSGAQPRMVAVPCLRCHLLVMLSTSSPSCPNCKFVHSLSDLQKHPAPRPKPLETLSLLH